MGVGDSASGAVQQLITPEGVLLVELSAYKNLTGLNVILIGKVPGDGILNLWMSQFRR
jgi:hypothetical protein